MRTRTTALAERFEQSNAEVIATIEQCSEKAWLARCAAEGWSVGVTTHHIANGYDQDGLVEQLISALVRHEPLPASAGPDYNEQHAERYAQCTREETLELLRRNGAAAARLIRGLSDEDLDQTTPARGDRPPRSVEQILESILLTHTSTHLESICATIQAVEQQDSNTPPL